MKEEGGRNENCAGRASGFSAVLSNLSRLKNTDSRRVPHGAGAVKHPFALPQRPVTGRPAMKSVASALSRELQLELSENFTGDWQFLS